MERKDLAFLLLGGYFSFTPKFVENEWFSAEYCRDIK